MPKKGYKQTDEHRLKLKATRQGERNGMFGKHFSEETKLKMRLRKIGKPLSEEHKHHIRESQSGERHPMFGKKHTEESKRKMSLSSIGKPNYKIRGKNAPNWQGGKTKLSKQIKNSLEYKNWRRAVFERDNYTCVICGARNGNGKKIELNADHIKPFCNYPELRFVLDNGRTLCRSCHLKTETFGNKACRC
jgi:hypothetical protein